MVVKTGLGTRVTAVMVAVMMGAVMWAPSAWAKTRRPNATNHPSMQQVVDGPRAGLSDPLLDQLTKPMQSAMGFTLDAVAGVADTVSVAAVSTAMGAGASANPAANQTAVANSQANLMTEAKEFGANVANTSISLVDILRNPDRLLTGM